MIFGTHPEAIWALPSRPDHGELPSPHQSWCAQAGHCTFQGLVNLDQPRSNARLYSCPRHPCWDLLIRAHGQGICLYPDLLPFPSDPFLLSLFLPQPMGPWEFRAPQPWDESSICIVLLHPLPSTLPWGKNETIGTLSCVLLCHSKCVKAWLLLSYCSLYPNHPPRHLIAEHICHCVSCSARLKNNTKKS